MYLGPVALWEPFVKFCWMEINCPASLNMLLWRFGWTPKHWVLERFCPINPIPLQAVRELNDLCATSMAGSPHPGRSLLESFLMPAASKSTACPKASEQVLYKLNTVTFLRFQKTQPHVQSQGSLPKTVRFCFWYVYTPAMCILLICLYSWYVNTLHMCKLLMPAYSTFGEGRKGQRDEKKGRKGGLFGFELCSI